MKKILVIGSTNIDFVVNVVDFPVAGETVMSQSFQKMPGGKGANQAYACGKLGGDTAFVSVIGDDGRAGNSDRYGPDQHRSFRKQLYYCGTRGQ